MNRKILLKLAAGPAELTYPLSPGVDAGYLKPESLYHTMKTNPWVRDKVLTSDKNWGKNGLIIYNERGMKYPPRTAKRHELVHFLNYKKGKYPKTGERSLKGVVQFVADEASAYRKMYPKETWNKFNPYAKLKHVSKGTLYSLQKYYGGNKNILKALTNLR